jgi:hypothetical protein
VANQATLRPLVELRRRDVDWATAVAEAEAAAADEADDVEAQASGQGGYTVELHRLLHEEGEESERRYGLTMGDDGGADGEATVSGVSESLVDETAVRIGHRVVAVGGVEVATAKEARATLERIEKECDAMSAGLLGATLTLITVGDSRAASSPFRPFHLSLSLTVASTQVRSSRLTG